MVGGKAKPVKDDEVADHVGANDEDLQGDEAATYTCGTCKDDGLTREAVVIWHNGAAESCRCKACNNANKRINAVLKTFSVEKKDSWVNQTADEKRNWIQQFKHMSPQQFKTAFCEHVEETFMEKSSDVFGKDGNWLDEPDLWEKYKNKPEQCKSMLANARKIWHSGRSCYLYEDADYVSSSRQEAVAETVQKRSATQTHESKPDKKPKVEKLEKPSKQKALTPAQKIKVENLKEKFAANQQLFEPVHLALASETPSSDDLKVQNIMPKTKKDIVEACVLKLDSDFAACDLMLVEGWEGEFNKEFVALQESRADAEKKWQRVELYLEELKEENEEEKIKGEQKPAPARKNKAALAKKAAKKRK